MRAFWSEQEVKALRKCIENGLSVFEIIDRKIFPHRTENSIRGKIRELQLEPPRKTGEVNWQALEDALRIRRI